MSKPSTTPPYKVTDDLVFYTFGGSMWCHAPSLALIECGVKKGDVEEKQVNLVEGANFDPNGFLKVNPKATVPAMEIDGKRYTSTVEVVEQILKFAPDAPKKDTHTDHELRKIIHGVHAESHDPNAMLVLPVDDDDLEAKAKGLAGGFIAGRQKALDQYVTAPGDFKTFIEEKHKANGGLQKLYTDSDAEFRKPFYQAAAAQWKSTGEFIRGELTHILKKAPGKFLGGADRPGEADFHVITWLARTVTCAGVPPGQLSEVVIPALEKKTGGQPIDPVVGGYWDSWVARPSFKEDKTL